MRRYPSINGAFVTLAVWQATIALLLAAALGASVVWVSVLSHRLEHAIESVRAVEEVQVELFAATRAHQLSGETGDPRWVEEQRRAEGELLQRLGEARNLVESAEERALVDQLAAEVHSIRRNVLAAPPEARTIRRADIIEAQDHAEALVDLNSDIASRTIASTRRWSRLATVVSVSTIVLTLAGLAFNLRRSRQLLYVPVRNLRKALADRGVDSAAHVPAQGPLEVRQITDSINDLIDRLSAQREHQLTFLASVAHDLRNPMSSLRTAAQLAERNADTDKQRSRVQLILRQVDRMNRLVEDLLDFSRIGAGQFELEPEDKDLRELVRDTVVLYGETTEIHELRVEVPATPVVVRHDPTRMAQVLGNLVSNAIKYAPEGGPIDVRLYTRHDRAVMEVQDRGLGIPEDEHESIFATFGRGGGIKGDLPGAGLGLAVARILARAHGGDIEVESEPGRGSTFRVVLPLEPAAFDMGSIREDLNQGPNPADVAGGVATPDDGGR